CRPRAAGRSSRRIWSSRRGPDWREPMRTVSALIPVAAILSAWAAGAEAQTVTRGPYLQRGSQNTVIVRWRTDVATNKSRPLLDVACGHVHERGQLNQHDGTSRDGRRSGRRYEVLLLRRIHVRGPHRTRRGHLLRDLPGPG